jgi:hypothetical protein
LTEGFGTYSGQNQISPFGRNDKVGGKMRAGRLIKKVDGLGRIGMTINDLNAL